MNFVQTLIRLRGAMSITVIIEGNVKDVEKWLTLFNELEAQRQEADINFKAFNNNSKP